MTKIQQGEERMYLEGSFGYIVSMFTLNFTLDLKAQKKLAVEVNIFFYLKYIVS